jgi:acetylornithine deacetylase/succinyl-diaminopimelate desuccinylase-like protein
MSASNQESDPDHRQTPAELLQRLIRFKTTNPHGNEIEWITFIRDLMCDASTEPTTHNAPISSPAAKDRVKPFPFSSVVTSILSLPAGQNWTCDASNEFGDFLWAYHLEIVISQFPTLKFDNTTHATDERIPVNAMEFGTRAILRAMEATK